MPLSTEQQRLVSMLDYLEQWDKLNRTPVFDVATHQGGFLALQGDLDGLPGVHLNDISGEIWMEIERLRPMKPPAPSAALLPWLLIRDDPAAQPNHRETLPNLEVPEKTLIFEESPAIVTAFGSYVSGPWKKWAESEKPRRRSIEVYDKLFNLLQTIETEGAETALELVWGVGMAVWEKNGKRVRYPLVSRLVEIDPIGTDFALRIRPREVPAILETDIYVELEIPGLPAFENAAKAILDRPDTELSPFDEASYEQLLSGAAGTLDREARYWPREGDYERGKLPQATSALTVTDTWVVFARRKGTNFLIDDVRKLKKAVEAESIPDGAAKVLVEDPEGAVPERRSRAWRGLSSTGARKSNAGWGAESLGGHDAKELASPVGELYFPKPFNVEQVQIIDRLEHASGVVVQGPPGTGKTHTIANVICHYLAEGKRVLVTSKGESALAVLRDQLPAPVRSLTVSLLTSEREGLKQLEQSVSQITTEISNLNKAELSAEIQRSHRSIDQLHQKITTLDRELGEWAKRNISPAPPVLDALRPAALAQHVLDSQAAYSWFPDQLDARPEHDITFDEEDINRLRTAREKVGNDLKYLYSIIPELGELPNLAQIGDLHRSLQDLDTVSTTIDDQKVPRFSAITPQHFAAAERLRSVLREAIELRKRFSDKWLDWLRLQYQARTSAHPVFNVVTQIAEELSALVENRRQFLGVAIEWEDEWDNDDDLFTAIGNLAGGKSAFGILPFGKKAARERHQRIRLNGKAPSTDEDWRWIESHIVLRRQTRTVAVRWNSLASECPAPEIHASPAQALRQTEVILAEMKDAFRWVGELAPSLGNELCAVFADLNADGVAEDVERMESLVSAIDIRLKRHRLESARDEAKRQREVFKSEASEAFAKAVSAFRLRRSRLVGPREESQEMRQLLNGELNGGTLPVFAKGLVILELMVGDSRYDSQTVEKAWQTVIEEIEHLQKHQGSFETIHNVSKTIRECGAPNWADRLVQVPVGTGETDWLPSDWMAAWKWSRQFGYLLSIDGREQVQAIAKQRLDLQNDLSVAYARLVEQLTWAKLKETLDQDRGLMSALQQYMAAIRGIGAGTGVRAVRHRQNARKAMNKANRAIRCWIMPHWRVSESLPSELALFDLVIVDEASQSDLWALPAMLRAKKLLIVGDNKQVSPSAVGVKEADIRSLHTRFLRTLPFGDVLSPEKSIYDLASVMFASDLVRLREHFRCVEPIIEFSNSLCYNGEIRCLRVAKASERITPPLVDVFVRDGEREGRSTKLNRAEARAIVDEIKHLTNTPAFAKRTIGVVSLLGSDQARLIFEMLVTELGEEKIVRHQIRCGDAMTFQGREADIIFISMVTDADTVRALSGEMYEQRFNVAVSRAKDRLYLYRSFKREDLKENDLRARLLDHFAAPLRRDPEKKGRERCESDFERAVYDKLHSAGYRITPQVAAGGYRIDMVVEGHSGRRLAIECDGDQYHTPDMWMDDLHRQRTLERAGWTFWRCWGSSFLRDPDGCMNDLFRTLESLGIDRVGAEGVDLTDVVEYREVGSLPDQKSFSESSSEENNTSIAPDEAEPILKAISSSPVILSDFGRAAPTRRPVQQELLPVEADLPLFANVAPNLAIELGDSIRFCFTDSKEDEVFISIVDTASNPDLGLINEQTPISKALMGLKIDEERDVVLPMGKRRLRVLELHKPRKHI